MMSTLCPVCNGLYMTQVDCPECAGPAEDLGRYSDMFGPYAPYRDIDELKMVDGDPGDHAQRRCLHLHRCISCHRSFLVSVDEW